MVFCRAPCSSLSILDSVSPDLSANVHHAMHLGCSARAGKHRNPPRCKFVGLSYGVPFIFVS